MTNRSDPNHVEIVNDGKFVEVTDDNELLVTGSFSTTLEQIETPLQTSQVNVTTTATNLIPVPYVDRKSVTISNNSDSVVYIGDSGVTTAIGTPLESKEKFFIDLVDGQTIYGIVQSGTADVRVLELK